MSVRNLINAALLLLLLIHASNAMAAHFARGVPSFGLNGDAGEQAHQSIASQVGDYQVQLTITPAFPKAGETFELRVRATRLDSGFPYEGEIHLSYRQGYWFPSGEYPLAGRQAVNGEVRFPLRFSDKDGYRISLRLLSAGARELLEFPLAVGRPYQSVPLVITLAFIVLILLGVRGVQYFRFKEGSA